MRAAIVVVAVLLLTACAGPISQNLGKDIVGQVAPATNDRVAQGLRDAAFNFDQAVAVGALDASDPAPRCLHSVLKDLGLEVPEGAEAAKAFAPRVSDLISAGSVLYIRARQAQQLAGQGITLGPDCKALLGQVVIDAARGGVRTFPGGGLLPALR